MRRYMGRDEFGTDYTFHRDPSTGRCAIQETMDCEPAIELNKERQRTWDGFSPSRQRKLLASIPLTLAHKWLLEDGVFWFALSKQEKRAWLRKKWNDPDFRYVRASGATTGRIHVTRPKLVVTDAHPKPRETIKFGVV